MSSSTARDGGVLVVVGPRLSRLRIRGGSGLVSGSESMTSGPKSWSLGAGVWVGWSSGAIWGSESRPRSRPRENEGGSYENPAMEKERGKRVLNLGNVWTACA